MAGAVCGQDPALARALLAGVGDWLPFSLFRLEITSNSTSIANLLQEIGVI